MHDRNCTATRWRALTTAATLLLACAGGLMTAPPAHAQSTQPAQSAQPNPEVRVSTNMGSFVIELRPDRAPLTVADFLRYVRTGFYTDTLIHRVVANFVIQGGGHEATPPYALKPTGPPVVNESGNGLENKRGTVGLARGPDPDSGTSQFYINLVDNPELDPLPTRWGYTVFGKVIQGMSVVEQIGLVPTGSFGPFKSQAPITPVVIKSITLVTPSQSESAPSQSSTTPAAGAQGTSGTASSASGAPQGSSATTPAAQSPATGSSPGTTPSSTPPATGSSPGTTPSSTPPASDSGSDDTPSKTPTSPAKPTGTPPKL